MSLPKLPAGHPFTRPITPGTSPFDIGAQLIAFRRTQFSGWTMKAGDDPDDEGDDDEGDDEDEDTDPDTEFVVGGKTLKVGQINRIMATEKRQGKKAGQSAALKALGFDSLDDATAFVEKARKVTPKPPKKDDDEGDSEAARRAAERETAAEERERKAKIKERRLDLRGALRDAGVSRDDLDDAQAMLDRKVDAEYDDDDLDDAVEELKARRPVLFGEVDDGEKPKPRSRATLPPGGTKNRNAPVNKTGWDAGKARAQRRWGKKD